jgi:hypothetical protein
VPIDTWASRFQNLHHEKRAELELCAQVIRFDPAGNDGARLRVVNVGQREIGNEPHGLVVHDASAHMAGHASRNARLLMPLAIERSSSTDRSRLEGKAACKGEGPRPVKPQFALNSSATCHRTIRPFFLIALADSD